jgi:hypothetical protein
MYVTNRQYLPGMTDTFRSAILRASHCVDICVDEADGVVSLIFVANSVGSLMAGTSNVFITDLIGYRFVSLV